MFLKDVNEIWILIKEMYVFEENVWFWNENFRNYGESWKIYVWYLINGVSLSLFYINNGVNILRKILDKMKCMIFVILWEIIWWWRMKVWSNMWFNEDLCNLVFF